jgi:hypothetical protein
MYGLEWRPERQGKQRLARLRIAASRAAEEVQGHENGVLLGGVLEKRCRGARRPSHFSSEDKKECNFWSEALAATVLHQQ